MKGAGADLGSTSLAGLLALGLLLASGCGEGPGSQPIRVGGPVPAYRAASLDGDTVALEDLRGAPVLLNVWATWCGPCRFETPFLQSLHEEHGSQGLQVVGISVDQPGSKAAIESFIRDHQVTYQILHDPKMRAMDAFAVLGLPATFLIDGEGTVRLVRMGPVDEDDGSFMDALHEVLQ